MLCFSFSWEWLLLFFLLQARVVALGNKHFVACVFSFTCFFFAYCILWNHSLQQKVFQNKMEIINNEIILEPDEYQINGDLLKFSGLWTEKKQKVQAYYRIATKDEKKTFSEIDAATKLVVTGRVEQILPPTNENQFDYQKYMRSKKIVNAVQVSKLKVSNNPPKLGKAARIIAATHSLRKKMINYFAKLPAPLDGYSQILLLGYYAPSFSTQLEQINKLGLLHLFSLSGMHIFYLLRTIRFILGYMHITRETCENMILFFLPFYAILGGLSSSLIRAVMMSWLMILSSKYFDNGLDGVEAESVVLILNLLYSPELVHSMGAQLSYLLTFVLMMSRKTSNLKLGLKMNGYSLPLVLWHTFRWNMLTTFISILIIPLFEWVIVPSVILGALFPKLSFVFNGILFWITKGIEVTAKLPANFVFGKPPLVFVLFWIGLMFALEVVKNKKKIYLLGFVSYFLVGVMIKMPLRDEIVFLDVGQGDCTLIRRRFNKEVTLIDTGGKLSFQNKSWQKRHGKSNGETVVVNYLLSKGISKINWLFLTHQDTDHVGNFPIISQLLKVEKILVPSGMEKNFSFKKRLVKSANKEQDVIPISTEKVKQIGQYKILHPFGEGEGKNESSIAVTTVLNKVSVIISGDLDKSGEFELCKRNPGLRTDILKNGHHGSKTSTSEGYVEQLQPKLAIISAGRRNRYGHPNQETLETLRKNKVGYLNTAEVGMIKVIPIGPNNFKIETGKNLNAR